MQTHYHNAHYPPNVLLAAVQIWNSLPDAVIVVSQGCPTFLTRGPSVQILNLSRAGFIGVARNLCWGADNQGAEGAEIEVRRRGGRV